MSSVFWPHVMLLLSIDRTTIIIVIILSYAILSYFLSYPIMSRNHHHTELKKISVSVTWFFILNFKHLSQLHFTVLSRIASSESKSHVIQLLWLLLTPINPFQLISIWFLFLHHNHQHTPFKLMKWPANFISSLSQNLRKKLCILYKEEIIKINGKKILYATSQILQFFVKACCVSRILWRLGTKCFTSASVKTCAVQ